MGFSAPPLQTKDFFSSEVQFPLESPSPEVAKIAFFSLSSQSLLLDFLKRRNFEQEVVLVNGTGQSFQRKLHLQSLIMLIMMWFVAISFSLDNKIEKQTGPDPNPIALVF